MIEAIIGGSISGLLFYGGLWLTMGYGLGTYHPERFFLFSFIMRLLVVILIMQLTTGYQLMLIAGFMLSFLITRQQLIRRLSYGY